MAVKCSQEAILNFLRERGGLVPNAELLEHFKPIFPSDPKQKAAARELFKRHLDSVAYVKTDGGVKCVCLRKKFSTERLKQDKTQEGSVQVSGRDVTPAGLRAGAQSEEVPHVLETLAECTRAQSDGSVFSVAVEDSGPGAMGNRGSVKREKRESRREKYVDIPVITVIRASPLPVQETVFILPQPEPIAHSGKGEAELTQSRQVPTPEEIQDRLHDDGKCSDVENDAQSVTGSEGTPQSSRKHFIEVMMCTSPEIRRNIDLRKASVSRSDSDSVSMASCNLDEDRNCVTLDPREHEWMLCASDADWESLRKLLNDDPGLVLKKDFVTGFTCLHWAAKRGKPELIALIINFCKQNNIPVSVDVRSSTGYTPLHIAAMHSHMEVVKLLVGAYNADVEIRDYSGRKACQYLTDNASVDIRDIIGAYEIETKNNSAEVEERWRFSKVFQAKPLRRLNSTGDGDTSDGGAREQPLRRRSSLSRMKPKLQNLRLRTSQLVHSTTFHGTRDLEKRKASRPKTHFFS